MHGLDGPAPNVARLISAAASDNATLVKATGVAVKRIIGHNARTSAVFLKLYQKATAPASTDTPKMTFCIPASTPFALDLGDQGVFFQGLGYRITTGSADNDAGALTAGDVLGLNIAYSG